jgi:hypothetical protein
MASQVANHCSTPYPRQLSLFEKHNYHFFRNAQKTKTTASARSRNQDQLRQKLSYFEEFVWTYSCSFKKIVFIANQSMQATVNVQKV